MIMSFMSKRKISDNCKKALDILIHLAEDTCLNRMTGTLLFIKGYGDDGEPDLSSINIYDYITNNKHAKNLNEVVEDIYTYNIKCGVTLIDFTLCYVSDTVVYIYTRILSRKIYKNRTKNSFDIHISVLTPSISNTGAQKYNVNDYLNSRMCYRL